MTTELKLFIKLLDWCIEHDIVIEDLNRLGLNFEKMYNDIYIAIKINEFIKDVSPYEYNDNYDSQDEGLEEILELLRNNKKQIKDVLEFYLEE